jgi:hypothetical protein
VISGRPKLAIWTPRGLYPVISEPPTCRRTPKYAEFELARHPDHPRYWKFRDLSPAINFSGDLQSICLFKRLEMSVVACAQHRSMSLSDARLKLEVQAGSERSEAVPERQTCCISACIVAAPPTTIYIDRYSNGNQIFRSICRENDDLQPLFKRCANARCRAGCSGNAT